MFRSSSKALGGTGLEMEVPVSSPVSQSRGGDVKELSTELGVCSLDAMRGHSGRA